MTKSYIFATSNKGKIVDANRYFADSEIEILSPQAAQQKYELGALPGEVEETGDTYEANALLKAKAYFDWSGLPTFADDSGLEVDALGGAPGLYSARYAGPECSFDDNINKLVTELNKDSNTDKQSNGVANRAAKFICVIAFIESDSKPLFYRGELQGEILSERRGNSGFGYDPIFLVTNSGKTLAQLKEDSTHQLESHRTRALHDFSTTALKSI